MIIAFPDDGRGLSYYLVDLNGQTVHIYHDFDTALRSREGDQHIAILQLPVGGRESRWLTDAPAPDPEIRRRAAVAELRQQAERDEAKADELARTFANVDDLVMVLCHNAKQARAMAASLEARS